MVPNYGPDGIDEPGTGAVLGRAFQRTVRGREQLAHVQKYETSLERGMLRLLEKYDESQARKAVKIGSVWGKITGRNQTGIEQRLRSHGCGKKESMAVFGALSSFCSYNRTICTKLLE